MIASEINPVVATVRGQRWHVGCLYDQETDEQPQLHYSHMLNVGGAYAPAAAVREGVAPTNAG
ncbi:DUF1259 domain-containing protein [Baekduia soli]|uniref:DUF1259 domain-containing protein n=1 Tax=Baekduia soli TaxID=496014 RepID=A0A5B8U4U9_9ACTN|nr:DUF1259 domain-containing protein [Baekduia soli]QEC47971.1 DUF1259 domain-containing protein [Baekduia soli]